MSKPESLPTLEDLGDLKGKKVLVRSDLNVPITVKTFDGEEVCEIGDDFRLRQSLATLYFLTENGAEVTVMSHLGRPKGAYVPKCSIDPIRKWLQKFIPEINVMENLRFDPREEKNSEDFVLELIKGQDYFVNDAFGVSHREHASVVGPPKYLKSAAGRLLKTEVDTLLRMLHDPSSPFVVIVGGAKISEKLGVLKALSKVADVILVGGGMAYTFLAACGHGIGDSLFEKDRVEDCKELLESNAKVMIPTDVIAMSKEGEICREEKGGQVIAVDFEVGNDIPVGFKGLDIGLKTTETYDEVIAGASLVFWNGPMGVFEDPRFRFGTKQIALSVANCKGYTVVGGGDSAKALADLDMEGAADYVSTGGGASLELLEFGDLPGLKALRKWSK